jgi:hypothetical protein
MADFAFASATYLAGLIRRRQIGCLELLDHFIARVERLDSRLNAVIVRDFERARTHARRLDNGPAIGPLHGVPITVKEAFDVGGLPTTWGLPPLRDNIAERDGLPVARLKAAGAVVFGKTNVPTGLADWQSRNEIYGTTFIGALLRLPRSRGATHADDHDDEREIEVTSVAQLGSRFLLRNSRIKLHLQQCNRLDRAARATRSLN